jgi:riboflavin synthase
MFTGIVQALGRIAAREPRGAGLRLQVRAEQGFLAGVARGDSIAVNGCCLTVAEVEGDGFQADLSAETLAVTTLGALGPGALLDLERALTLATPLGGHLVAGHVDGVGEVVAFAAEADGAGGRRLRVRAPAALARYLARKGSVAVDGVSLTVNAVDGDEFESTIVPHTERSTVIGAYAPGVRVNLEVDLVARYAERLLEAGR